MSTILTENGVRKMDEGDPLATYRDQFYLPKDVVYLDGNSLGAAPKAAFDELETAAKTEWADQLIRSWRGADWWVLGEKLGNQLAELIGAGPDQVTVCDTTSINIYKALHAALSLRPDRSVILTEAEGFPTDSYIAEGVQSVRDRTELRLEDLDEDTIEDYLDETVAVVLINHIDYRSASVRNMKAITEKIHAAGAIAVWDLCHSAGIYPVDLEAANADFAAGCTYKYLNGGPGSPAFIYAAKRHHGSFSQPLSGWWGHVEPFAFEPNYTGDTGIRRLLCGTQPILSMRALKASLDMYDTVDMAAVRKKSQSLTSLFIDLVDQECDGLGVTVISPRDADARGSQVSLAHGNGAAIVHALTERGVIGGFREPNVMRFGFAPLYLTHHDVWLSVAHLKEVLETEAWREDRFNAAGKIS
ncbi:MAG: kynureninase [Rhodospirillaceae bacterium]|nr:kynureninase [Rhodospirillaceae bacterium]